MDYTEIHLLSEHKNLSNDDLKIRIDDKEIDLKIYPYTPFDTKEELLRETIRLLRTPKSERFKESPNIIFNEIVNHLMKSEGFLS